MMILKWHHGVMVSLFIGGLLIGSGGISGRADDGESFTVEITDMIKAIDDGETEPTSRVFATRKQVVKAGEELTKNPKLNSYWGSVTHHAIPGQESVTWKYDRSKQSAQVTIKYIDAQRKQVGEQRSSGKFSQGGRMKMKAPAGYRLKNPSDQQRMAITSRPDVWEIAVEPVAPDQSGTTGGTTTIVPKPDETKPLTPVPPTDEGKHPDQGTNKPDKGGHQQPGKTPGNAPKPQVLRPRPTRPGGLPSRRPELVVPVEPQPLAVPRPQVPYPTHELDHVSELAEHPVTVIGEEPVTSTPNRQERPLKPRVSRKRSQASGVPRAAASAKKLPQTGEQPTWLRILGVMALTGTGVLRFHRFKH
ncbi:LPXTG cell wall anchor domain-containing protein [Levilactobacillus tujiorum]|uniref:LPXTG cell wall anchor domain-containing protein n=1 Tax=Levilactobacillus tujiorum TaxID=2912243 RepID=A0ABX1L312_9LACO|nr:LPXTG cell wall anchor domain-containing protein [Levilactobacillus tujiorum]MCH5464487.1 LPXTG cell wall anchor domain-containing protein [Levilactobacillus tujiorum]NLR11507.1 LPXTG cell wall anchor domain-containing protein [Lactobacillus sp. HBUAS51387]NLR29411.1 LPXTG cell wall anchor domain-containing protein [Levilactobacillus tujiorum]